MLLQPWTDPSRSDLQGAFEADLSFSVVNLHMKSPSGWWFGTMGFYDFPYIGKVIIPTVTHSIIFQRGRYTTNQPHFLG